MCNGILVPFEPPSDPQPPKPRDPNTIPHKGLFFLSGRLLFSANSCLIFFVRCHEFDPSIGGGHTKRMHETVSSAAKPAEVHKWIRITDIGNLTALYHPLDRLFLPGTEVLETCCTLCRCCLFSPR